MRAFEAVLDELAARGAIAAERDVVQRARRAPAPTGIDSLVDKIVTQFKAWGFETQAPKDVAATDAPGARRHGCGPARRSAGAP